MKASELKGKNLDELNVLLLNFKKELFNLRFQRSAGSLTNTARFSTVRRTVARIMTMLTAMKKDGGNNA
jgi:large subunit ribosomal protein L29